jgi:hypothetical protein
MTCEAPQPQQTGSEEINLAEEQISSVVEDKTRGLSRRQALLLLSVSGASALLGVCAPNAKAAGFAQDERVHSLDQIRASNSSEATQQLSIPGLQQLTTDQKIELVADYIVQIIEPKLAEIEENVSQLKDTVGQVTGFIGSQNRTVIAMLQALSYVAAYLHHHDSSFRIPEGLELPPNFSDPSDIPPFFTDSSTENSG